MGVMSRNIDQLSGGELQRFAIAVAAVQKADVYVLSSCARTYMCRYMFDEPSSYLDVKQRLKAAAVIRNIVSSSK